MPKPTRSDVIERNKQERMLQRIENPMMAKIAREKNRYINQSSRTYAATGDVNQLELIRHEENMFEILRRFTRITTDDFGNHQRELLERKIKQTRFENVLQRLFDFWIVNETGNKAKETATTTQDDIKRAIEQGVADGETNKQISKRILRVKGLTPFRSETIARTEIHNAAMYAMRETAFDFQVETGNALLKKWVPVTDGRTRDIHRRMSSHPAIPINDLFQVGNDRMDRPGDPRGSAENVINCRCVLIYETVD